jgi:hypothetical protein
VVEARRPPPMMAAFMVFVRNLSFIAVNQLP